jgi:hypothetical protein
MSDAQGQPPVTIDAVVKLLRDDRMRGFRIDVETDSLVEADQSRERNDRTAFVTAVGGFFKEFGPIVQQMPPLAPLASSMLQFAVRGFKVGAMAEVAAHLAKPPAPPQPTPDEQIKHATAQVKGQAEVAKANASVQEAVTTGQAKQTAAQIDLAGKVIEHHRTVAEVQNAATQGMNNGTM